MKKSFFVAAMVLAASSASAYEVHRELSLGDCHLLLSSIKAKGYDDAQFIQRYEIADGVNFGNFYSNSEGKVVAFNFQPWDCHLFIGTVQDMEDFETQRSIDKKIQTEQGLALANEYGL